MRTPPLRHRSTPAGGAAAPLALALALVTLAGCTDGGGAGDTDLGDDSPGTGSTDGTGGGGAGDGGLGGDGFEPSPIEPFVGTWDLLGDWNGTPGDQAFLVIGPVEEDGRSRVRLYDFDEGNGCYFRPPSGGRAELDGLRREEVFMNNVFPFDDAVLDLSNGALVITYFDTFDTDRDGDAGEVRTYLAPPAGLTETDLVPAC